MLNRKVLKNSLTYNTDTAKFRPGQIVCNEGEESNKIYIVLKGEFEVSKVIDVNENDLPGQQASGDSNK